MHIFILLFLLFFPLFSLFAYKRYMCFRTSVNVIPGPPVSSLLLGNLNLFRWVKPSSFSLKPATKAFYIREFYNTFHRLYNQYREEGVFRLWMGPRQVVYVLTDVESAECLLTSPANVNKGTEYQFMAPWLGQGLFLLNDDAWRRRRRLLTPAFHYRTLADFLPIFGRHARRLVKRLESVSLEIPETLKQQEKECEPKLIPDIRPLFEECMLDIIKETSLGVKDDHTKNDKNKTGNPESSTSARYRHSLKMAIITSINRVRNPLHWWTWLFRWTSKGRQFFAYKRFMDDYATGVINRRLEYFRSLQPKVLSSFKATKLIDILLLRYIKQHTIDKEPSPSKDHLNLRSIRHEISTFIFGGHDTTAVVVIFAVLLLGHHKDVQERIVQEIEEIMGVSCEEDGDFEREWTLGELKQMKHLEAAIRETMRLHPPGQIIGRRLTEDLLLPNGKRLIAGSNVYIPLLYVHRDDRYYPQKPENFCPQRWYSDEEGYSGQRNEVDVEKGHPPPFAFLTFSAGQRNCIGQRYGMLELKYVLAEVLRRFEINSVTAVEDVLIGVGPVVTPLTEIGITIKRRRRF